MNRKDKTVAELFFDNGEPTYQPALGRYGIRYREPTSSVSSTGWFRGDLVGFSDTVEVMLDSEATPQNAITREAVAEALGVTVKILLAWETATDLAAEERGRADDFGW